MKIEPSGDSSTGKMDGISIEKWTTRGWQISIGVSLIRVGAVTSVQ